MATKYFIMILLFISCISITRGQSVVAVDTTVIMSDGIKIDAVYAYPTTTAPIAGYPAVVIIHGFGGSKDVNQARQLAGKGYAAVAYSVRGQGQSEGFFDFFTSDRIRADLQAMINFTKSLPKVNKDRIGVTGGSQGGIHAWMAAAYQMGVRAVVSTVANGRFDEDWAMNNAINWLFSSTIQNVQTVRFAPIIKDTITPALQRDDFLFLQNFISQNSTTKFEQQVTTPALILVSYFDQYFNPGAALRQFARIPAPKRIVLWPAGHSGPTNPSQQAFISTLGDRWFAYWLKDQTQGNTVTTTDSAVVMFDQATTLGNAFSLADSALWLNAPGTLPQRIQKKRLYFTESGLSIWSPVISGQKTILYIANVGSTSAVFRSTPFTSNTIIAGTIGNASLVANSPVAKYQMNLMLYDYDPSTNTTLSITRGHYEVRNNSPSDRETINFNLNSIFQTIKAGHVLEARVSGGIGLIPKSGEDFGNAVVATRVSAVDTLFFGGNTESYFDLYYLDSSPSYVEEIHQPSTIALEQNYPNPFSEQTTISFRNYSQSSISLRVYDQLGREVKTLIRTEIQPGDYQIDFDGNGLAPGVYHAVLSDGTQRISRQMMLIH